MDHLQQNWNGDFLAYCSFWKNRTYWGFGEKIPFVQWRNQKAKFFGVLSS